MFVDDGNKMSRLADRLCLRSFVGSIDRSSLEHSSFSFVYFRSNEPPYEGLTKEEHDPKKMAVNRLTALRLAS